MKKLPKVYIIVLNYNGKEVTNNCLKSISVNDYTNFELIVVDNNSADSSLEQAKARFPKATFIESKQNVGFSAGNNLGIRHALESGADYVLLLNNDTVVEKDFLTELICAARKVHNAGIICPLIYGKDKKQIWFSRGRIDWLRMKTVHQTKIYPRKIYESPFISGCAMLIPADVLEKVGMLDDDYFLYWEDADFCVKVRSKGYKTVVAAKSIVYHLEISEDLNPSKLYWLVYSGLIFFEKNTPNLLRPWIWFYLKLRKAKNWFKRTRQADPHALIVHKAYQDFENKIRN